MGAATGDHDVIIANNKSKADGAGVYIIGASAVFTACTIENNSVIEPVPLEGGGGSGGGIYAEGPGTVRVIASTVRDNTCYSTGGGIAAWGLNLSSQQMGRVEIVNSLITGNTCNHGDHMAWFNGNGGGVAVVGNLNPSDPAGPDVA